MIIRTQTRPGAYHDSVQLMQLHAALEELPGVVEVSAVMATPSNQALLESRGLLSEKAREAGPDDLVIVVQSEKAQDAESALDQVDALLRRRRSSASEDYRPRSLSAALRQMPDAGWISISVPGRHAAGLARQALEHGLHVFLYSDNVSLEDEAALKKQAQEKGLLVLGPDCGTAVLGGLGFGFSNRVGRGSIGLVAASGTGLQAVACGIHKAGGGISQAIGTGGRDLDARIGGVTALQAIDLLGRDPDTDVIVLISKPPHPSVSGRLLSALGSSEKPSVVHFIGQALPARRLGTIHFASSLSEAAAKACNLLGQQQAETPAVPQADDQDGPGCLRALFSGGTLAWELLYGVLPFLSPLHSNLSAPGVKPLEDPFRSQGHTVLDLGADDLTVGRLHPMMDPSMLLERLRREAEDEQTGLLLLDLVLGQGAHPDPASRLAPVIEEIRRKYSTPILILLIGTEDDPQDLEDQRERLSEAGALLFDDLSDLLQEIVSRLGPPAPQLPPVPLQALQKPNAIINAGVEAFGHSLSEQGVQVVQMDWRPPAGGDDALAALLEKMRKG